MSFVKLAKNSVAQIWSKKSEVRYVPDCLESSGYFMRTNVFGTLDYNNFTANKNVTGTGQVAKENPMHHSTAHRCFSL